jgi:hypothetical protein
MNVDIGTVLLIMVGVIVVLVLLDLLFAGGAMTGGMMSGMAGMMGGMAGSGYGLIVLLLLVIVGLLVYGFFFR